MKLEVLVAIVGLVILEAIALIKGIDGKLFGIVIMVISGLAGYNFNKVTEHDKILNPKNTTPSKQNNNKPSKFFTA